MKANTFPLYRVCMLGIALFALCWHGPVRSQTNSIPVRVNRWLEIRQLGGAVRYRNQTGAGQAAIGTRLQAVGDSIQTLQNSYAALAVDTGIGFVKLSENTTIRIQQLQPIANGGRLTRLQVTGGQVRLQVRPFTNPRSGFQLETPAGWRGVRGTEVRVSVHPNGNTGVAATLESGSSTADQVKVVEIDNGFESLVIPREPPLRPVPRAKNSYWTASVLAAIDRNSAQVAGQTDLVNLLSLGNISQSITREGQFNVRIPSPANGVIRAVVITPLGKKQVYELAIP